VAPTAFDRSDIKIHLQFALLLASAENSFGRLLGAAPEARFAANFVKLGIHPGFAITSTLPRLIGQQRPP
jgi:hypothetical protein